MKILIASDIHGDAESCQKLLDILQSTAAEGLLLLGDILYHGPRNSIPPAYDPQKVVSLLSTHKDAIICVRGNCDAEVDQMLLPFPIMDKTCRWTVDGRAWFAAHGHREGANPTENDLPDLPVGSVFLSGHTHIPVLETDQNGIIRVNPGSVTFPKGGSAKSCILYDNGRFSLMDLERRVFKKFAL